jgi:nucleotide-binding universal stress UspA family protein
MSRGRRVMSRLGKDWSAWRACARPRPPDRSFGKVVANTQERVDAAGVEITVDVRAGRPARLVIDYAESCQADAIVVGHRRRPLEDLRPASTADRVARQAGCPVMVVR